MRIQVRMVVRIMVRMVVRIMVEDHGEKHVNKKKLISMVFIFIFLDRFIPYKLFMLGIFYLG